MSHREILVVLVGLLTGMFLVALSQTSITTALPTSLVTRLARQQSQTVDFATSNVRGAPIPMYIAGAKVLHNYPMGPLSGVAFNLTLLSYMDSLDMGLHIDAGAVAEPVRLRKHLDQAFKKLVRA
jgi:hypothetical protein